MNFDAAAPKRRNNAFWQSSERRNASVISRNLDYETESYD